MSEDRGGARRGGGPREPRKALPGEAAAAGVPAADTVELSSEDLERRLGGAQDQPGRVVRGRRVRTRSAAATPELRRRILWRDSATIVAGVLLAILAARFLIPGNAPAANGSPSPEGSLIAIGTSKPTASSGIPIITVPPIVNPSLDLEATPTPVPVITLPPITPRPSVAPTTKPGTTPKPSVKPSPGASPTPAPPPVAAFSCTPSAGLVLTCSGAGSTNTTGYSWNWGDSTTSTGQTPAPHTYASDISPVAVTLTVTGPGGTDQQTIFYNLVP